MAAIRRWCLRVAAALAAALLSLVAAEAIIRVTGLASPPVAVTVDQRRFDELPGVFFPSSPRMDRRNPRLPHTVSVNTLGFRGPDVPRAPASGESRIVFIGDSFTWGDFVNDDQTLPYLTGIELAKSCRDTQVLNFGVGGTTIDAHRVMFRRSLTMRPDLVVLVFHDNDPIDLRAPTYWEQMAASRAEKSRPIMSLLYGTARNTALWTVLRQAITRLRARGPAPTSDWAGPATPDEIDGFRERYASELDALLSEAKDLGVPILLTAFPSHLALRDPSTTSFGWFAQHVQQRSLPYGDIREALLTSGHSNEQLYLLPHDGHASPLGNQIAARALADLLRQGPAHFEWCTPR